ncbi:VOC family protein [Sanguibacter sp. 25GB23B1]|uniref:VOC family protein n=1 Tax=unclassified Sanguibacter TaxID=2645534 RepID=UPI0032AF4AE0
MSIQVQVTFDANAPERLGRFWCAALDYVPQAPPDDYPTWSAYEEAHGTPLSEQVEWFAAVDPAGRGPRLYFQKVPEGKTAKNRVHLDINAGKLGPKDKIVETCRTRARSLTELGATVFDELGDETTEEFCIVMNDPEGNEFCVQ